MASIEFFFKTRGLLPPLFSLACCCFSGLRVLAAAEPVTDSRLAAARGEVEAAAAAVGGGGELLRPDNEERPLDTAESLSESSCFQAATTAGGAW